MTDTSLAFGNYTFTTYAYEPFSYRINAPDPRPSGYASLVTSNSAGMPSSYLVVDGSSSVIFGASSNGMTVGAQTFTISALDASTTPIVLATSSNNVNVLAGRFTDPSGGSLSNARYTFYSAETITPIKLRAPFSIGVPTSTPTLPPGLTFSNIDVSTYAIVGTPLVTSAQTNYLIIGKQTGTSKVVSSTIGIVISNERIVTDPSSIDLSSMAVDAPISPKTITARGNGTFRYSWSPFPDGIYATDSSGNVKSSGFSPSDVSNTMIVTGTPSLAAANAFRDSNYSNGVTQYILAERAVIGLPLISSFIPIKFGFTETILFDNVVVPPLYTNVDVSSSGIVFRANTYFSDITSVSTIFSPNLRSDLSLSFSSNSATLVGTPLTPGEATYRLRASNARGTTQDISVGLSVSSDSISFLPPTVDACYNFIVSRPVENALAGYYTYPITFAAESASRLPIHWSAPGLLGTRLSLSATTGSNVSIVGTPVTVTPLQTLTVTASVLETSATNSTTIQFAILEDIFKFDPIPDQAWIQNKVIDPVQFFATTTSGSPILRYSATGLPPGITITSTGLISGFTTVIGSGTFTVTATTGYSSGSKTCGYNVISDNLVIVMPNISETVPAVFSGLEFRALTYSGKEGTITATPTTSRSPWQGSNFSVSFVGNYLQGDFSTLPALLPAYQFAATGVVGTYTAISNIGVTVNNPSTFRRALIGLDSFSNTVLPNTPSVGTVQIYRNDGPAVAVGSSPAIPWSNVTSFSNVSVSALLTTSNNAIYGVYDMAQNSNVMVATIGSNMIRSPDFGTTWIDIPDSNISKSSTVRGWPWTGSYAPSSPLFGCIATDGASNWVAIANGYDLGTSTVVNVVRASSDNGQTWADTNVSPQFVDVNSNTKLFYNKSRYFVLAGTTATNPILYASSANLQTWTAPAGVAGVLNDMTVSNDTLLAVGSNGGFSGCYSSSNNGTAWSPLVTAPIEYLGSAQINTAFYAYGKWAVGGADAFGAGAVSFSSDLSTWVPNPGIVGPSPITSSAEDGAAWIFSGPPTGSSTMGWDASGNVGLTGGTMSGGPSVRIKRTLATHTETGTASFTISPLYDSTGIGFTSPTTTSYNQWQFVPITPIVLTATPDASNNFIYYYTTTLPDGLRLVTDATGTLASIVGTSVKYSDAYQRVVAFAARGSNVSAKFLSIRTVLPTVQKQQDGAGSWTSFVRQYTEVNAAETARDNKALPAMEYRLGEFTSPTPPSTITAPEICDC